ncbi:hypothetical protein AWB68_07910 [Caballeronia choica]|uniref:Uncharacterized protein n=1 Tax=Caballeronia choica TaxID=326476 RepID=A0A158L0C6_9BURK|nr:hypothetical protein AWB68_07910 [Caballeronia choica]
MPRESDHAVRMLAFDFQRQILALRKQRCRMLPQRERPPHERQLHAPVAPVRQLLRRRPFFFAFSQPRTPLFEIHRASIVGVDETEIPQLGALIEIGHARRREPQQRLLEAVDRAGPRDPRRERRQLAQEAIASLRRDDVEEKLAAGVLVGFVGREPARAQLRLAQRLQLPLRDAFSKLLHAGLVIRRQPGRPAADERLIQHRLGAGAGRPVRIVACDGPPQRRVQRRPVVQRRRPFVGNLRERRDARAHVFAALVVVRRGREHRVRERLRALQIALVKRFDRQREFPRIGADFIARQQSSVSITRRILDGLRRHRRGQLREQRLRAAPLRAAGGGGVGLGRGLVAVASALGGTLARLLCDGRLVRQLAAEPLRDLIEHDMIRA